jgi:hypothetical protein
LFLLDLPYGQTAELWDTQLDLSALWEQLLRVGTPTCSFLFFTTAKFGNSLINSKPDLFRYDCVWVKTRAIGWLQSGNQLMRKHELIYVFSKPKSTYNPQLTEGKPYTSKVKAGSWNQTYRHLQVENSTVENQGTRQPTSVLEFPQPNIADRIHATQKPVELCEWLIRTFSNEGDMVLDPTMGSGSIGIACLNSNRKFIGIELDTEIFKKAEQRLTSHQEQVANAKQQTTQELFGLFQTFLTSHQAHLKGEFVPPEEPIIAPIKRLFQPRSEDVWDRTEIKDCGCGGTYRNDNRARHMRTERHTKWEENGRVEPSK